MDKNEPETTKLSGKVKLLGWLAFIFIIFSFIAPYLFTGESSYDRYNFTQTGPIGDTIGGLMNPFIAIAGVIMTFLAFLMQVRANEIQKDEFRKSLKKSVDEKILEDFHTLQLLGMDIDNVIYYIDENIKYIDDYISKLEKNPYYTGRLQRDNIETFYKPKEHDRKQVYNGLQEFCSKENDEWIIKYNALYECIDYIPNALQEVRDSIDFYAESIRQEYATLRKRKQKMEELCITITKFSSYNSVNHTIKREILHFFRVYDHIQQNISEESEVLYQTKEAIKELINDTGNSIDESNTKEIELIFICREIYREISDIERDAQHTIAELNRFKKNMQTDNYSAQNRLKNILPFINKAIEKGKEFKTKYYQEYHM